MISTEELKERLEKAEKSELERRKRMGLPGIGTADFAGAMVLINSKIYADMLNERIAELSADL